MSAVLTVRDLTVSFDSGRRRVDAVRGVSFALEAGRCLAIVGESGSGKSVTARALLGLAGDGSTVRASTMELDGTDLTRLRPRQWQRLRGRVIGLIPQAALVALDPLRTVGREVAEPLRLHRTVPASGVGDRVIGLLGAAGVPAPDVRVRQRPGELSGGLRQRVLIASAIACDPRVVIADEPTTALDVTVQAQILELLAGLRRTGTAMLLISHDLAVVARLADEVVVMRGGRVVERGPTRRVLGTPEHEYTRMLLDAVPGAGRPPPLPDAAARPVVLRAEGLVKTYRLPGRDGSLRAVDDVSLTLRAGETLGVVGESGSGKSTLARLVTAMTAPDAGRVELLGGRWHDLGERERRGRRREIQTVYQDPLSSFDPRHTVGRILRHALEAAGDRSRTVGDLLELVGLDPELSRRHPSRLSGGQQQRVAIARAVAVRPRVVVCDEPVSALDVSVAAQVLRLLTDLQREHGLAYLFISHHLGVIREMSHRVLVMKDGRVVESGATDEVLDAPRHPYTASLLASLPALPPREPSTGGVRSAQPLSTS
ncbi:dipeptide ABC transporter ATP-binding protein [Plantactinospora endophytica]|uniref:ABC transporter ATP-binding protein n=1 Tax=Plantactinospora endophytica TaxID=673535 RepID=A0ABQ4E233_9ACTN|nr:ABC transporter ATP-binding protein [Plantactinospora endophytica]GIG88775.1 ABC transporter ATP-binding protein [Plantactinospora endophytica]